MKLRILDIAYETMADGPGLRTSIYCAGCAHACPGCHNPQSWDENGGEEKSVEELFRLIQEADMNVTFTGGDPMLHPEGFTTLARMIKENTDKTIWCYTGYRFEDLIHHPQRKALLEWCDVLVDSPFIWTERDLSLPFRGSRNQRIIDVQASLKGGIIEL
jgi:anaerobic ribonucleoside-triphosphate reductase activating protein